ncbi:MAG: hypothetical protein M9905_03615 [Rhizobiaceae bacterium]|nr:hypothetical protein [Rhizobiaceae bacterium]
MPGPGIIFELTAIGDYIAEHNPNAAGRVVEQVHTKTARLISDIPFIERTGVRSGEREVAYLRPLGACAGLYCVAAMPLSVTMVWRLSVKER